MDWFPHTSTDDTMDEVASILSRAKSALFITGAGLSADSGLPTYRGVSGLYNRDAEVEDGMRIEEILSGETFAIRPELTWKYVREIEQVGRNATFNRGHVVLAELERLLPRVWVLTQNVDGYHKAAGSRNLIDIHGDVHNLICSLCGWGESVKDYRNLNPVPHCPACGGVVRPDVVLFGEMLPTQKLRTLQLECSRGFDMVFSVGTSSLFSYITQPVDWAISRHIPTVEINPGDTEISGSVQFHVKLGAAAALDAIFTRFQALRKR